MNRGQPVTNARRPLVLQRAGGGLHLRVEALHDVVGVALEEVAELRHQLPVVRLVDLADARSTALLDVEQQAWAAEALMLVELARAARANRKAAQQQIERVANRVRVGIRPEVLGSLALAATHHQRAGKLLVERDREKRVALVVAQADVEARPVLLDEAPLEHQRLDLVAHLDPLHGLRRRHHLRRTRMHVARILEVVRQPLTQAGCLADIDDPAERVLELVRPGRIRNRAGWRTLHHRC